MYVRRASTRALARLLDRAEAFELLRRSLASPDGGMRTEAVTLLTRLTGVENEIVPEMVRLCDDGESGIRLEALRFLAGRMESPEARARVFQTLTHEDRGLRRAADAAISHWRMGTQRHAICYCPGLTTQARVPMH